MPKLLQFDVLTSYNVVADNQYWSIFICLAVVASEICEIRMKNRNPRDSLASCTNFPDN